MDPKSHFGIESDTGHQSGVRGFGCSELCYDAFEAGGVDIVPQIDSATITSPADISRSPRLYKAFLDPDAMAKWLPPNGFTCKVHHMDTEVGGTYKMSFTNFSTGHGHSFGGKYLELVPGQRIRYSDKFDDPKMAGEMQTTITFKKVSCTTELNIMQEGIPAMIPTEMCYLGWQESLILLAKLVEPEIP